MLSRRTERRLRRGFIFALSALVLNLTYPTQTHAAPSTLNPTPVAYAAVAPRDAGPVPSLPTVANKPRPEATKRLVMRSSAYTSSVKETDGDPWTTASGAKTHDGTIATNCLPFGTKIRLPEVFGDKIFTVQDRMAARWGCKKIDIWMTTLAQAKQWGVRTVVVEIL